MPKINIVWDATQLDTFQSCPYKFNIRHNLNLVTPVLAEPLDKGDLMHHGKEGYYNALKAGNAWESALEAGIVALRMRAADHSDLPAGQIDREAKILEENCLFWKVWDTNIDILAVEQAFSYVLFEDDTFRIIMTGKIDLLFSNAQYVKCPMDTKTYERDWPLYRLRNQFLNYTYATDSNYLFIDRVGLQGLPGEVKKPMSPEEKHKRRPLSYDPLIKEQFKNETIKWAMIYYDCETNNDWPRNLTSCDKFNRLCEYYEVCDSSGEPAKEFKLKTNFKSVEQWDVTASHGKLKEVKDG